jgi:CheY-like chemotaxis protein
VAKILVADDNSNIQKMVGLALKDQGIDVVAVGNGEAAVRKISDIRPDLVLADVFMPVRNGYEVCRYVKEDSSLSHIPVILLVGAFDPLDEQEAQRVGADGVLKKPFVPPDPLISMVKSALIRAGVPLGPAAPAEKAAPAPPRYPTAEILGVGVTSKLAALAPEKLPEVTPDPVEEFPTTASNLKIAAGSGPLAFGSLLDTSEADDMAVTAKPMIDLANAGKWHEDSDEVEEEKEEAEEAPHGGGWRPGGLDEVAERAAGPSEAAPDWRDEAFHGASPAKSFSSGWAPAVEHPEFVESAGSQSVAVATIPSPAKPAESPAPFTSDAWAAAMAAGIEEKAAEIAHAEAVPEIQAPSAIREHAASEVSGPAPVFQPVSPAEAAEPANWAAVSETAWEVEAKKASLLASTWDAPKAFSVDETQDLVAYAAQTSIEQSEAPVEAPVENSPYSAEPVLSSAAEEQAEPAASEASAEGFHETAEPKQWAWETPAASAPIVACEPARADSSAEAAPAPTPSPAVEPDMDELVARVLGKMNPEMLQKVTREILKPVIEAIVRDEINSKKS